MIEVLKQAIDYIENVPDDRDNVGHIDRKALVLSLNQSIKEWESQEPYGWVSQHTTKGMYEWQFNKEIAGVYQDTAISILPVYTQPPQLEQNFCPRCGKRTNDIHTCTPPQRSESSGKPSTWVGLTEDEKSELWEISRAALPRYAIYASLVEAKLKEKNA